MRLRCGGQWNHLHGIAHERDVTDEEAEDLGHVVVREQSRRLSVAYIDRLGVLNTMRLFVHRRMKGGYLRGRLRPFNSAYALYSDGGFVGLDTGGGEAEEPRSTSLPSLRLSDCVHPRS